MASIEDLNLPQRIKNILVNSEIRKIEVVTSLCRRELVYLPGLGVKSVDKIQEKLSERGLSLAEDPWGPYTCARHGQPSMDTTLESLFLCDECGKNFQNNAFKGKQPEYVGIPVEGYCQHCNKFYKDVCLRQWYLCGVCGRVVTSIGRSIVADEYFLKWWEENGKVHLPHLEIKLTDPPELQPRDPKQIKKKVSQIDFICEDSRNNSHLFGIELKTGRSHLRGGSIGSLMQQFQLDNSDCDDILEVVRRKHLPVYLVHAQVIDRATPPTIYYAAVGLWWTDLFSMQNYFNTSRTRPRETRIAAYYNTSMFSPMNTFIDHLLGNGPERMKRKLEQEGIPKLY